MTAAAEQALDDAGCERRDIDGLLCGYSTTMPHLMLSTVFAEHFGLRPAYAHAVQLGGATGFALVMLAHCLVEAGMARRILVVAGENRLSGQSSDTAIQTLLQIGHPVYEVPLGPTVPAYYALVASRYMHDYAIREEDLAELAVLMRRHAARHPGAHLRQPVSVADVMASRPIAEPLKLLDCCPISDGGAAIVVSREPIRTGKVRVRGCGQAHLHQHVTEADVAALGAAASAASAMRDAGISVERRPLRCHLRQLHHHPGDPARRDRSGSPR